MRMHGAISQKAILFILAAVRTDVSLEYAKFKTRSPCLVTGDDASRATTGTINATVEPKVRIVNKIIFEIL
jgi:hypothetical protein